MSGQYESIEDDLKAGGAILYYHQFASPLSDPQLNGRVVSIIIISTIYPQSRRTAQPVGITPRAVSRIC